jgi:O-succinylbenzoic acid--CoA ligase
MAVQGAAHWLQSLQLDPARLEIFNPLPLHHVSGLMPVLRARAWGAELRWLTRAWMRDPLQLLRHASPRDPHQAILSLVPTQLQRLLAVPDGVLWLQRFALIWIGGDALLRPVGQPFPPGSGLVAQW